MVEEVEVVGVEVEETGSGLGAGAGAGAGVGLGVGVGVGDGVEMNCAPTKVKADMRTNESSRSEILLLFCMKPIL